MFGCFINIFPIIAINRIIFYPRLNFFLQVHLFHFECIKERKNFFTNYLLIFNKNSIPTIPFKNIYNSIYLRYYSVFIYILCHNSFFIRVISFSYVYCKTFFYKTSIIYMN